MVRSMTGHTVFGEALAKVETADHTHDKGEQEEHECKHPNGGEEAPMDKSELE